MDAKTCNVIRVQHLCRLRTERCDISSEAQSTTVLPSHPRSRTRLKTLLAARHSSASLTLRGSPTLGGDSGGRFAAQLFFPAFCFPVTIASVITGGGRLLQRRHEQLRNTGHPLAKMGEPAAARQGALHLLLLLFLLVIVCSPTVSEATSSSGRLQRLFQPVRSS